MTAADQNPSNPYQPPAAEVELEGTASSGAPTLFAVGPLNLIVLSLATFNLYQIWWLYKNWSHIKASTGLQMWPFWRAFFGPLWFFSLVARIRDRAEAEGLGPTLSPGLLGVLYLALSALIQLPDPWWLLGFLSFIPLVVVDKTAAAIEEKRGHDLSALRRWSVGNWLALALGGLLFLLALVGTFLPEVPLEGG